jgi:CheY-like chemotaxis protein
VDALNPIERVILIDDNEMDNYFHTLALKDAGFAGTVSVFEDGESALADLAQLAHRADTADTADTADQPEVGRVLIFLDINMPGMDGFDVAERLVPLLRRQPNVVVLLLTSSDSPEDIARAKSIPIIKGFLTKPLTRERLAILFSCNETDGMNHESLWPPTR